MESVLCVPSWHALVYGMDLQLELGFYVDVSNAALVRLDSHLAMM